MHNEVLNYYLQIKKKSIFIHYLGIIVFKGNKANFNLQILLLFKPF